ncbi:Ig-like domain-containing protein [Brevibacillus choshinensis]|uniref:Ig-like domain-containing protein n=1 Tax=Brevibacillus choshinensis TaxID=54911 RepID=UPI002E21452D|nr:Ig-like domain-containing protein [Brevibacillus choshinensis]
MGYRKNTVKKAMTVLLSTSVILSMASQALASTSSVTNANASYAVSSISTKAAVSVESVTAGNGSLIIKLSGTPANDPRAKDFTLTTSINNKTVKSPYLGDFVWNKSNNTVYFTFTPISASAVEQAVQFSVKYNGSQKTANTFTVAEKGSSVDKITIINHSPDNELTVSSKDDASLKLVAVLADAEGDLVSGKNVTWTSSNKKIATVDRNGKVNAVGAGKAKITAKVDNKSLTFDVNVLPAPPKVSTVTASNGSIKVVLSGAPAKAPVIDDFIVKAQIDRIAQDVEVTAFSWDQSKKTATISFERVLAASKDQYVTISASYKDSTKSARSFKVSKINTKVASVQIENKASDAELTVGSVNDATLNLNAVAKDKSGKAIEGSYLNWKSSNKKVATVDKAGKVTAVGAGKATITATIDGNTATIQVTVNGPAPVTSLAELNALLQNSSAAEIILGSNISGNVTIDRSVTIDGKGYTLYGDLTINDSEDNDVVIKGLTVQGKTILN